MSKFTSLKVLKQTKARADHICFLCGQRIPKGETYFREYISDTFLHSLHAKKFCVDCSQKHGESLLKLG